tara:strand:- start:74 stop:460 length:387 start_codon:yes stop_codon:yes gene_type:complete
MKKLTLSVGLLAGIMSANAQDTLCTYFTGKQVIEFNYYTSEIISEVDFKLGGENQDEYLGKYYEIKLSYGDVLCLDLSDDKKRVRKVITIFFDGSTQEDILDSENDVYFSPRGATKILVGKPKFACKL